MLRLLNVFSVCRAALPERGFFKEDLRSRKEVSLSVDGVGIPSAAVEALFRLTESFGRLDLRPEKNG